MAEGRSTRTRTANRRTAGGPDKTPMMEQYGRIKGQYRDCVLLFRMGDFYEMFYEDAELASRELGLTLTSREKGEGPRIPLAGVPWHSLDHYLGRLVRGGHRVAVCDQVEEASEAKGLVKREVVRVVTPGTLLEEGGLEAGRNNYLVAIGGEGESVGLARVDLSTGEFEACEFPRASLLEELSKSEAAELLVPRKWTEGEPGRSIARENPGLAVTGFEEGSFLPEVGARLLEDHFAVETLDGFGLEAGSAAAGAAGAALHYLRKTKQGPLRHITGLRIRGAETHLELDEAAIRNLEVLEPQYSGEPKATLRGILDHTRTPMGSRLLRRWLREPLRDIRAIEARLEAVECLWGDSELLDEVRRALIGQRDLERLVGRVGCERATPRDLLAVGEFLRQVPRCGDLLAEARASLLAEIRQDLAPPEGLGEKLGAAIGEDAPLGVGEGGIFRDGYSEDLDGLRSRMKDGRAWMASLQEGERKRTKIPTLKVGFNRVFGYYLEVTRPHLALVPDDYERRQTLVGAERFVTRDLKEREAEILGAEEKATRLEKELFAELRRRVAEHAPSLLRLAGAVAQLDVLASLARVARENDYVRPRLVEPATLTIEAGRHPVVERMLTAEEFVANDTRVDTENKQILLITGPNMAGKSTYLRQVALITIMAQAGSFVPAASAEVGIVDRIFTRVGAADDLARGRSTFLVEMQEVAVILHNATPQSLIILDEVGRGTSTFDGLSIAWALTEYLHDHPRLRARTLFATHYHELTELARQKERLVNLNVEVREWQDRVVFLRKIVPGASDQSYGIQVARLAGLPREVIERARAVLASLEEGEMVREALLPRSGAEETGGQPAQLSLFSGVGRAVAAELAAVEPEKLTPLEAINVLCRIKEMMDREEGK